MRSSTCAGVLVGYLYGMTGVIDDMSLPHPQTPLGTGWSLSLDRVMGGVSQGALSREVVDSREALRLTGDVRLDNNGGFVQAALDLVPGHGLLDASGFEGIALTVQGAGGPYNLHLRTDAITRPWQSYRQSFEVGSAWREVRLLWSGFEAYRVDAAFDPRRLWRLGLVAIGREMQADLAAADLRFF